MEGSLRRLIAKSVNPTPIPNLRLPGRIESQLKRLPGFSVFLREECVNWFWRDISIHWEPVTQNEYPLRVSGGA